MIGRFYRKGEFFDWAVVEKASGKMIGTCGFARLEKNHRIGEIGYVLNPAYHGRGYATEAASAVIRYGFETLGLNRIEGRYMVENIASRKVMEHCGLVFEGVLRESMMVKGRFRDIGLCSLLLADYRRAEMKAHGVSYVASQDSRCL
jgi:ribosomal-protein-alanine N-acetyltransferase